MSQYFDLADYYHYDQAFDFDLAFYQEYASQCRPPILELACGTGRLTIPMAQTGFEIFGIDNSPKMLERCETAVDNNNLQDRVHLNLADMTSFDLPRKDFGLIFVPLRSFMHLLTQDEQIACLQRVRQHLRPGGLFIIDVIAPDLKKLTQRADRIYFVRREFDLPNDNHVVRQIRLLEHDPVNQVRYFEFNFEEYDTVGHLVNEQSVPVTTRYIFRQEMRILLESSGFEIIEVFRDYDKNPYDGTGEMIVVSRRRWT